MTTYRLFHVMNGRRRIDIRILHIESSKSDIELYVDGSQYPAVRLYLVYGTGTVIVRDLICAGPGSTLHHQGLGILAVNTGIQMIQWSCPPETRLSGEVRDDVLDMSLSPTERLKQQEDRRRFWKRFGFNVTEPDIEGHEFLQGTVGSIQPVVTGQALGEHPRYVDIRKFQCSQ